MNAVLAIILLVLGLLLVFVWGVHIVVVIFGWLLAAAAVVWLLNYLFGNRTRT
jgi:hypothetical protein